MKIKKIILLFGTVFLLNTMLTGCSNGSESAVQTEEKQADEALPGELNDVPLSYSSPSSKAVLPDSQLIHVIFDENTSFYMKTMDGNEESHAYKECGFQDLKEHMSVEMKGSFKNDTFYPTEIRFF